MFLKGEIHQKFINFTSACQSITSFLVIYNNSNMFLFDKQWKKVEHVNFCMNHHFFDVTQSN